MSIFEGLSRECRQCGCDDCHACYDPRLGGGCGWVEADLCSMCGTEDQFQAWLEGLREMFAMWLD